MKYKYPLSVDPYTYLDRLKICNFVLNKKNRLTIGPEVQAFEKELEDYSGAKHCVLTSSGSTANHLLYEVVIQYLGLQPSKTTVFCPATTWISSVTPAWMRGCQIKFIDINLKDFSFNYDKLEKVVKECKTEHKIIWPTALIGFIPNIKRLREIADNTDSCYLYADLCETMMGYYEEQQILSCFDMCTTSFFLAHEICGIELGALFLNDKHSYEQALMLRSHGLSRVLPNDSITKQTCISNNSSIDPEFLFACGGTNWRPTDINAKFARLDFKRVKKYEKHRRDMWEYYLNGLGDDFLSLNPDIIPFCLPVVLNKKSKKDINEIKEGVRFAGFEARPIIACLPVQPFFKHKGFVKEEKPFTNSLYLNNNGFYVGLHKKITKKHIDKLLNIINNENIN